MITPLGVPAFQSLMISATPDVAELDPKDEVLGARTFSLPATLTGVIERPGDLDRFRFEAKAGDQLVIESQAKSLGSPLLGRLTLEDDAGHILGESAFADGAEDPQLSVSIPRDGHVTLKVTDTDYAGTPGHFYRIGRSSCPTSRICSRWESSVGSTPDPGEGDELAGSFDGFDGHRGQCRAWLDARGRSCAP